MEAVVALAVILCGFDFEMVPGKVRGRCVDEVCAMVLLCATGAWYDDGGDYPHCQWDVHVRQGAGGGGCSARSRCSKRLMNLIILARTS